MWDQSFQVQNLITRQECTEKHNAFQNKTYFFCLYLNLWHFWWLHLGEMIVFCNLLQCLCIFCKGSTSPRCGQCEANPQRTDEDKCHVAGQTSHFWTLFLVSNLSKSILVISHLHCCFSAEGKWNSSPTRSSTSWTRESSARCWEAQSHNWYHYWQSSDARSRQSLPSYCRGEKFGLLVFLYQ